jgi:hypothetical protein
LDGNVWAIVFAVAEASSEVGSRGIIPNRPDSVLLISRLGAVRETRITHLGQVIDAALIALPATMRTLMDGLQSLHAVCRVCTVKLAPELRQLSSYAHPR